MKSKAYDVVTKRFTAEWYAEVIAGRKEAHEHEIEEFYNKVVSAMDLLVLLGKAKEWTQEDFASVVYTAAGVIMAAHITNTTTKEKGIKEEIESRASLMATIMADQITRAYARKRAYERRKRRK